MWRNRSAVASAGRRLLRRTGNRAVLVTRGAKGMCLFERGRPMAEIPPFGSDEVADVTGAGDTVIAAFTLALLAGGIVLSLLWLGGRKTDFKCIECDHKFSFRRAGAWISLVVFWILIGLVIFGILTFEPDGTE